VPAALVHPLHPAVAAPPGTASPSAPRLSPLSDQAEGDLRDALRDRAGAGAGDGRRALRQVRPAPPSPSGLLTRGTNLSSAAGGG